MSDRYECIECQGSGRATFMPDGHGVECGYCEGTGVEVSSEELACLVKLEQLLRKRRGYYRGLPLDDPKSMHINATSRAVYVEICNLFEEAGLK